MPKLREAGFFQELSYGPQDGPSLREAVEQGSNYAGDKAAIVDYLKAGRPMSFAPRPTTDVLDPSAPVIGPLAVLADGTWAWPSDLAYYVEMYDIALPSDFLAFIRQQNYQQPPRERLDL